MLKVKTFFEINISNGILLYVRSRLKAKTFSHFSKQTGMVCPLNIPSSCVLWLVRIVDIYLIVLWPPRMSLPRTSWVKLNRLRTGVGRFHLSMYKWGLAPSPNCEYVATEQTADHVISSCLLHHVPRGTRGLLVVDDATRCWLNTTTASI